MHGSDKKSWHQLTCTAALAGIDHADAGSGLDVQDGVLRHVCRCLSREVAQADMYTMNGNFQMYILAGYGQY